jgi:hypothetical protein
MVCRSSHDSIFIGWTIIMRVKDPFTAMFVIDKVLEESAPVGGR